MASLQNSLWPKRNTYNKNKFDMNLNTVDNYSNNYKYMNIKSVTAEHSFR